MVFDDKLAYIPMFAVTAITAVLFVLLIQIKKNRNARVSFIAFLADLSVLAGSLVSAILNLSGRKDSFLAFGISVLIAAVLILPYCVMLTTFEPQKFTRLVPKSTNKALEMAEKAEQEAIEEKKVQELSTSDIEMLEISRKFMAKATEAFDAENGTSLLLDYINKTVKEEIKADGGAILMIDDFEDVITVKSFDGDFPPPYKLPADMPHKPIRVATNFKFASFPLRDNIFGEIATAGKPELITDPLQDSRIYQNEPEEFLKCGSYIIIPMKIGENVIGVTAFSRNAGQKEFTEENLKTATTLTDFAASAIKNVISVKDILERNEVSKEADIATRIQETLKPAKLPVIKGVQLGSIWNPNEGVCGDYYDVIVSRKDRISFIMSDIAGKGINSIVIMTMVRAMLRLVVNTKKSAGTILTWVNKGIAGESFSTDHFGSCALLNYNPETSEVELATGGTIPVYYFDGATKEFNKISSSSEPIGVEKASEYKDLVQKVKKGDIIITFTDGIVETLNDQGQQYTKEALLKKIADNCDSSSKDIANLVKADIKNFSGSASQHDDQTLLVIKF